MYVYVYMYMYTSYQLYIYIFMSSSSIVESIILYFRAAICAAKPTEICISS